MAQLQEVRLERDQLMLELSQSRAELTSLHSARATQQALERCVRGSWGRGREGGGRDSHVLYYFSQRE